MTFLAFMRKRPMVLMRSCRSSTPSATILRGVSATLNSGLVALLTPASVACAESTTATSRVKGLTYSSSPLGSGLAAAKRAKISATRPGEGRALRGRARLLEDGAAGSGSGPGRTAFGMGASRARVALIDLQS